MIKKATIKDVPKINELGKQLHNNFEKLFHIETEISNKNAIVLVAQDDNNIVGYLYALIFPDNIDLLSIFIDKNMRCQHIGTQLLQELKSIAKNQTITLEVSSKNTPAISLYTKNNFKKIYVRKNYYENSDAILMKWGN